MMYGIALVALISIFSGCNKENEVPATTAPLVQGVFLSSVPTDDFQNLTLKDFPIVEYRSPKVILWNDKLFVRSYRSYEAPYGPDILEYDLNGNLLAYTDKKILTCPPNDIAVSGNYLFASCMNVGIYKIDLVKNKIVYFYDGKNGLENTQNLQLAADEGTLWVGTFRGLGKIDIKTDKVVFYGNEIMGVVGADLPNTHVYARNGEVWATVLASSGVSGGAARYDSENDKWISYTVKDFKKRDFERIDFDQFFISDDGVYAIYQDNDPDNETLAKFDSQKKAWDIVYQAKYEEFEENVSQYLYPIYKFYEGSLKYLPPRETYASIDIEADKQNGKIVHVYAFYDAKWIEVPFIYKGYVDAIRVDDSYYLLSNIGIDEFTKADKFPRTIAVSDNIFTTDKSKLFSTDDKKYIVFFSINFGEMGGEDNAYGIGVYDIQNKTFFDKKMENTEFNDVLGENFSATGVDFENLQFIYTPGEIKIPVDGGELVIDLINQKFFARKL